jgi:hypothetical protein
MMLYAMMHHSMGEIQRGAFGVESAATQSASALTPDPNLKNLGPPLLSYLV